jgi:hypothetical protein
MARREKKEKDQRDRLLEQIDFYGLTQEEVPGHSGLIKQLTGKILQRALEWEMDLHAGYEKHDPAGDHSGDSRNGQRIHGKGRTHRKSGGPYPGSPGPGRDLRAADSQEIPETPSAVQRPDHLDVFIWDDRPGYQSPP